jgi:hypothetical protein
VQGFRALPARDVNGRALIDTDYHADRLGDFGPDPVTITIRLIPDWRSACIVLAVSGRTWSFSTKTPAGAWSIPTKTVSAPSSLARRRAVFAHAGVPVTPPSWPYPR